MHTNNVALSIQTELAAWLRLYYGTMIKAYYFCLRRIRLEGILCPIWKPLRCNLGLLRDNVATG